MRLSSDALCIGKLQLVLTNRQSISHILIVIHLFPVPHICLKGTAPFIGAFLGSSSNTNDILLHDMCRERIGSTVGEKCIRLTAGCSQGIEPTEQQFFPNCAKPKAKLLSQEQNSIDI